MLSFAEKVRQAATVKHFTKMRVSGRRLQAVLKIYPEYFSGKELKAHYQMLRKLLRSSGQVREHDVFISLLEEKRSLLSGAEQTVIRSVHRAKAQGTPASVEQCSTGVEGSAPPAIRAHILNSDKEFTVSMI